MKILLIAPASGSWRGVGRRRFFSGKTFRFSMLSLLTVAAETPQDVEVKIVDEQIEEPILTESFDLVGITAMTAAAPRAYEIARWYRQRGVPVVMGGYHASLCPDEALEHVDGVCVGDAESAWPRIVEDAKRGRVEGVYRAPCSDYPRGLKPLPRHLISGRNYATIQAVQATRGCPNRCAFCSVSAFYDGGFRMRPVEEVARDVAGLPERFFIFVDDSLTADPDYARELFRALKPLNKHWMSQATLRITDEPDLVALAEESGCVGLFVGLETFSSENLNGVEKGFNRVEEYRERIEMLHEHSIGVEAGIVFGFGSDGPDVFQDTLRIMDDIRIDMAQISILTPLPGTPYYTAVKERLTDSDWSHYDYHHAVFRPQRMTRQELKSGHDWITREFYRPWRIGRRLVRIAAMKRGFRVLPYAAGINLAYFGRIRSWGIRGTNPALLPSPGLFGLTSASG